PGRAVEEYPAIAPGRINELVEPADGAARRPAAFPAPPGRAGGASPPRPAAPPPAPPPAAAAAVDPRRLAAALAPARELRGRHRLAEALAALKKASSADGAVASSREARYLEAELCFSLYRPAEAVAILEPLCREFPAEPAPRLLLARTLV